MFFSRTESMLANLYHALDDSRVCSVVYGYVLGFVPECTVFGIERGDKWYLPGGPIEADELPDVSGIVVPPGCNDPARFAPLAWHVKAQTGLEIESLYGPFAVNMHPGRPKFAISMFYLAQARGDRAGGTVLTPQSQPAFAAECPVEPEWIPNFLEDGNPLRQRTLWQWVRDCLKGKQ